MKSLLPHWNNSLLILLQTIIQPRRTQKSRPTVQSLYIFPCLIKFLIDIRHSFCLPPSILYLMIIPSISQDLMERVVSLPKSISKLMKIILTYLKLIMRMFVLGFSHFLCKAKLGLGSRPHMKQASQILSSF